MPIVELGNDHKLCEGDSVQLENEENNLGGTLNWKGLKLGQLGSSESIVAKQSDVYILELSTGGDCNAKDIVEVIIKPIQQVDLGKDKAFCSGEEVVIDAGATSNELLWNNDSDKEIITVNEGGQYWVTLIDGNCSSSDTINVTEYNYPTIEWENNNLGLTACFESIRGIVLAVKDSVIYDYAWLPNGENSNSILVNAGGIYEVTISNEICSTTDRVKFVDYCETTFFIPNSFTPNGDLLNDTFKPEGTYIGEYSMDIFNRWGELIFSTSDLQKGWDGTVNGNDVQQDVYVWRVKYKSNAPGSKPNEVSRLGHVSVVR